MPQVRIVTLNYDPSNPAFGPSPRRLGVQPGDTIQFQIGDSTRAAHAECRLRITLHDAGHFSQGVLQHGSGGDNAAALSLAVQPGLSAALAALAAQANPIITGYKCELLNAGGQPIPGLVSDGNDGGEIVPDTEA